MSLFWLRDSEWRMTSPPGPPTHRSRLEQAWHGTDRDSQYPTAARVRLSRFASCVLA